MAGGFTGIAQTQNAPRCYTDEMTRLAAQQFPEQVARNEAMWKQMLDAALGKMDLSKYAKTTFTPIDTTTVYHIPVVFHLIHNYGDEFNRITDNIVYEAIKDINLAYNRENADTSALIPQYKGLIRGTATRYVGKTKFVFHLAQLDPMGQPTNGITRQRHYLTLKGGDPGKLGGWAPDSYVNIWINKYITNKEAAAYATPPASIEGIPSRRIVDGVMIAGSANGGNINQDRTIAHELGHYFSLSHVWGGTNSPGVACGDDGVMDTPPTKGHPPRGGCNQLDQINDTTCTTGGVVLGKLAPDSARWRVDSQVNRGISFDVYSRMYLDSVDVYSGADSGNAFAVQLTRNGAPIELYQDTFRRRKGTPMTLPLKWTILPGKGYEISFLNNPGFYADTNTAAVLYQRASGVAYLTSNDTGRGNLYHYFYKWRVKHGYFKIYDTAQYRSLYVYTPSGAIPSQAVHLPDGGFLVDYPDTTNAQNIMEYTYCSKMFSAGQAQQMRLSASSPIASRNNLSTLANLIRTGIMDANGNLLPRQDVRPVADFSVQQYSSIPERMYVLPGVYNYSDMVYKCTGQPFVFTNRTTGDTVKAADTIRWTFSNGATPAVSYEKVAVQTTFSEPGWATVSLMAKTNAGSDTETRQPVYVADPSKKIAPIGYFQDFNPNTDLDRWPIFNYYNNSFKWEPVNNVGGYDQTSMKYKGFDYRYGVDNPEANLPGSTPDGDFDDFFSPPFDLNGLNTGGNLNLNFMYAGASRSSLPSQINDTFQIFASTDCGNNWRSVITMSKGELNNNGVVTTPFVPGGLWNWTTKSVDLRSLVSSSTDNIMFRFRYRPGIMPEDQDPWRLGTGNNFYIDRIHISNNGLGVDDQVLNERGMVLAPNPTTAGATVLLKNATGTVNVTVSDVTGKIIYRTTAQGTGSQTAVEIPAGAVSVKGIYFVQVATNSLNQTEKLVVR